MTREPWSAERGRRAHSGAAGHPTDRLEQVMPTETPIDRQELAQIIAHQAVRETLRGRETPPPVLEILEEQALAVARVIAITGVPYLLVDWDKAILCFTCGHISHNPNDVAQKYCGHCHKFHEEV